MRPNKRLIEANKRLKHPLGDEMLKELSKLDTGIQTLAIVLAQHLPIKLDGCVGNVSGECKAVVVDGLATPHPIKKSSVKVQKDANTNKV